MTVRVSATPIRSSWLAASEADGDRLTESLVAQNGLGSIDELFDLLTAQGLTAEQARSALAVQVKIDALVAAEVRDQLEHQAAAAERSQIVQQLVADLRDDVEIELYV